MYGREKPICVIDHFAIIPVRDRARAILTEFFN
jgi:hypothetical protein